MGLCLTQDLDANALALTVRDKWSNTIGTLLISNIFAFGFIWRAR